MKFASLLAFIPFFVHANDIDSTVGRFQYSHMNEADFDDGGSMSYDRYLLQITSNKPTSLGNSIVFIPGFRYTLTDAEFQDVKYDDITDLHEIELQLNFLRREEGNPWSYNLQLRPGIATDFDVITSDDFYLDAFGGASYQFSDKFSLNFGLAYLRFTGEPSIIPFVGFIWNPTEQWKVSLIGPVLEARYMLSEDWNVRFTGQPGGGQWNVNAGGSGKSNDLNLNSYNLGVSVEHRIGENLWVYAGGGLTLNNLSEISSSSGKNIYDDDADSSTYFVVGLRLADW